jgi:hypothetical protein
MDRGHQESLFNYVILVSCVGAGEDGMGEYAGGVCTEVVCVS